MKETINQKKSKKTGKPSQIPVNSESKGKQSLKELSGSAEVSTVNHQNKSDSGKVVKKNENSKSKKQADTKSQGKSKKNDKKTKAKRAQRRWIIGVSLGSFLSTVFVSFVSDKLLSDANLLISVILLLVIVLMGIVFDIIGIAITSVEINPFNAMAAKKVKGAKTAVGLIKNAPRVSNLCNDVIGDICGVVSGTISVSIAAQLTAYFPLLESVVAGLICSGAVACLTVGGKAFGKEIALNNCVPIIKTISTGIATVKIFFRGSE